MAPKAKAAAKEEAPKAEEPPAEEAPKTAPLVWVFGINDHLELPQKLPAGFAPSGDLRQDFADLGERLGVVLHPAFKPKVKPEPAVPTRSSLSLKNEGGPPPLVVNTAHPVAGIEGALFSIRSVLLDQASMSVLSMVLPTCPQLRVLTFSDCRLDGDMLKLLRQGLEGGSAVESLQIEWNPIELPLPAEDGEDAEAAPQASPKGDQDAAGGELGDGRLEERERRRYRLQSQRHLRSFGEWLESFAVESEDGDGSKVPVWQTLSEGCPFDLKLGKGEFVDVLDSALAVPGGPAAEIFEVLDGPDYAAGAGKIPLSTLRAALESLPAEEDEEANKADPVGLALAEFVSGDCCLESISLRACAITRRELAPLTEALALCPWQLRSLNLWENRICDRAAEALATALEKYRGLEYLGLGRNRITDIGCASICRPYNIVVLTEETKKAAEDGIKEQQAHLDAVAKAKAKAKAAPGPERKRQEKNFVDEMEERPPASEEEGPTWAVRKYSELKVLTLSDNPIRELKTLEAMQPLGPRGVELAMRGTPAAAQLLAKRPELAKEKKPFFPGGEGWLVRVL